MLQCVAVCCSVLQCVAVDIVEQITGGGGSRKIYYMGMYIFVYGNVYICVWECVYMCMGLCI